MPNLCPCLWFDGTAEEAANLYTSLLPNSRVDKVWRSPADTPSGPAGMVLTVDFTLNGQRLQGLNGGPDFTLNEAVRSSSGARTRPSSASPGATGPTAHTPTPPPVRAGPWSSGPRRAPGPGLSRIVD